MTLSLAALRLIFAGSFGLGACLLARDVLERAYLAILHLRARRRRKQALTVEPAGVQPLDRATLYGVGHINWPFWSALSAVGGATLSLMLLPPSSGLLRLTGVFALAAPWLVRRYLQDQGRRRVGQQVRAFVTDLRLALALEGSLGPTLMQAQKQGHGVLYERLRLHLQARLTGGAGEEVLRELAADLRSPDLDDLLFRLQAAARGAKSYEAALGEAAERVALAAHSRTLRGLKAAPVRLIVPIILTIFAPALVLALFPLVARIVDGLGAGPVGF